MLDKFVDDIKVIVEMYQRYEDNNLGDRKAESLDKIKSDLNEVINYMQLCDIKNNGFLHSLDELIKIRNKIILRGY